MKYVRRRIKGLVYIKMELMIGVLLFSWVLLVYGFLIFDKVNVDEDKVVRRREMVVRVMMFKLYV